MASNRKYAYYLRGNQIALIEEGLGSGVCSLSGYSNQTTCEAAGGTWTENATGTDDGVYRSPTATITDGLEIEYAYSPRYRIDSIAAADKETVSSYETASGYLRFNGTSFSTESTVDYIVVSGSERWNGLHKVTGLNTAHYTTSTKYSGNNVTETPTIYTDVDVLNDESDDIDLPEYLAKALVYYVKAKLAEDMGDMERLEYNNRQFRAIMQRHENSRIWGSRRVMPGSHAIR